MSNLAIDLNTLDDEVTLPPAFWEPQVGPQVYATMCPVDIIFFGGERGGGKSDCIIGRHIKGAVRWGEDWNGLIIRRKYKDFAELRRRWDQLIRAGLPAERIGGDNQVNVIKFDNGARVTMVAINHFSQLEDYQGHQYTEISVDEATNIPFIFKLIDTMKGNLRSAAGVPCQMFLSGNPGGPGHVAIKTMFIIPNPQGMQVIYDDDDTSYIFIPSGLSDNKILCENDPKYVNRLRSIKDPILRAAWLEGDWDAFIGQAFGFNTLQHMIDPLESIPANWPLYMTFDWGFGKPFSIGWWVVDPDDRLIRFKEWYGCVADMPDTGLRLTDNEIAAGIVEMELKMGIWERRAEITRLCGHDSFSKKPSYDGGGQGPSTAEAFIAHELYLVKADPTRILKIRQFRERLLVPKKEEGKPQELPMMIVTSNCTNFIRTIPALAMDENKPEDIDSSQEDHCFAGGTLVDTDKGQIPIRDLVGVTGRVLTAGGYWTDFYDVRMTRRRAAVVIVKFACGREITCTGDHEFFTIDKGYIEASDLKGETCHVSIPTSEHTAPKGILWKLLLSIKPHRNSTAKDTGCVGDIFREKVRGYMWPFGDIISGRSKMDTISTTKTTTEVTTKSPTCKVNLNINTSPTTAKRQIQLIGKHLCEKVQLLGMVARRAFSGTKTSMRRIAKGKYLSRIPPTSAFTASPSLSDTHSRSIAPENVNSGNGSLIVEHLASVLSADQILLEPELLVQSLVRHEKHGGSVKVLRVEPYGKEDVFCLTAAGTNAFCIEGGILVHNCYDEAAQICMARAIGVSTDLTIPKNAMAKRIDSLMKPEITTDHEMPTFDQQDMNSLWEEAYEGGTINTMDDD